MARDILKTDRLSLRDITHPDLPFLHRIFGDVECMRYYPGIKSFDETTRWFQRLAFDSYASHGFGLWAVTDRQSGALLGDCGITLQETSAGLNPRSATICGVTTGARAMRPRRRPPAGTTRFKPLAWRASSPSLGPTIFLRSGLRSGCIGGGKHSPRPAALMAA